MKSSDLIQFMESGNYFEIVIRYLAMASAHKDLYSYLCNETILHFQKHARVVVIINSQIL